MSRFNSSIGPTFRGSSSGPADSPRSLKSASIAILAAVSSPMPLPSDPSYGHRDVSPKLRYIARLGLPLNQSRLGVSVRTEFGD
jgi:hypothetical protein